MVTKINRKCNYCGKKFIAKDCRRVNCSPECSKEATREYRTEWQRCHRNALANKPSQKKVQCLICGKWYVQVGSHVVQTHGVTAREYREHFDLEVKKGIVPLWYRKLKAEQSFENGTYKNLRKGAKYRFKKGSKIAGRYHRSHITIERLKKQFTIIGKKKYGKINNC